MMLSRVLPKASFQFRSLNIISILISHGLTPKPHPQPFPILHIHNYINYNYNNYNSHNNIGPFVSLLRHLSTDATNNNDGKVWDLSPSQETDSSVFSSLAAGEEEEEETSWLLEEEARANDHKLWSLEEEAEEDEDKKKKSKAVFDLEGISATADITTPSEVSATDAAAADDREKELLSLLKGPNRAFGDLIAASGITDAMLDSLIALKDFEGVDGLPPLREIEDLRYEKTTRRSIRAEIERQKQEEAAKSRVRKVDDKGRAYGTGKRKCSIARVWIQPGQGKFLVNDKDFDVYFPMLDHRAALLQPFSETKTLGLWDVNCTVKGGGVSGQVGAIQLGVSRALQNWEPDLRPPLRSGGFLTRDSRVVERKKPGKAKARKSFQWVKR